MLEDFERTKEILKLKEECFVTNFTKLEKETLASKEKVESLLVENQKLSPAEGRSGGRITQEAVQKERRKQR